MKKVFMGSLVAAVMGASTASFAADCPSSWNSDLPQACYNAKAIEEGVSVVVKGSKEVAKRFYDWITQKPNKDRMDDPRPELSEYQVYYSKEDVYDGVKKVGERVVYGFEKAGEWVVVVYEGTSEAVAKFVKALKEGAQGPGVGEHHTWEKYQP